MFDFSGVVVPEDQFLRHGLRVGRRALSVAEKLNCVRRLRARGVRRVSAGSLVRPTRTPRTANPAALFSPPTPMPGVMYTALTLNPADLQRANAACVRRLSASISASKTDGRETLDRSMTEAQERMWPAWCNRGSIAESSAPSATSGGMKTMRAGWDSTSWCLAFDPALTGARSARSRANWRRYSGPTLPGRMARIGRAAWRYRPSQVGDS